MLVYFFIAGIWNNCTFQVQFRNKIFTYHMPRYKLTIEYEGTRYSGWQHQQNAKTIQGEFFKSIKDTFGSEKLEFYGAGRTDAGVHATGQVAHLDISTNLQPHVIRMKMNDTLPHDISVLNVEKVNANFHARFSAEARSYMYHISTRRTAFGKPFVWWVKSQLDVEAMNHVAELYTGFKDFKGFSDDTPEEKSTTVEMKLVTIHQLNDSLLVHLVGSHFLWKQVRRMIGIMVEVGKGKLTVRDVEDIFKGQDKIGVAHYTAPPSGLYLQRVYYPGQKIQYNISPMLNMF